MKKVQPKDYKVNKYSVASDERVLKIEGGRDLNTKVNVGTMLKLLGGSIYKSNVSAFREQLVNAISHGCIAANQEIKEGEQKAFVDVLFDFNKRRVVITDVNGMGIPWNVMDEVVTSLGDSGNQDRTRSGQFGCGMFSFIRMADTTIIETWSKETDEHYAYISEGSKWYEIENRELNDTGTRIMITFKPDVDMLELVESTKTISDFQPVDVFLHVQGWQKVEEKKESVANYGRQEANNDDWFKGNGLYELGNNKMEDDLASHVVGKYSGSTLQAKDVIKLEDKDNDIEVYFTIPQTPFDGYGSFTDLYLCNIPIGGGIAFDGLTSLRVNFTNEKTWSPPVDRDRLTDESMKMAEKCVNNMITTWLGAIEINSIDEFKNHTYRDIVNSRRLDEWINQNTLQVLHALRSRFSVWKYVPGGDNVTAETLRKNRSHGQAYLSEILEYNEGNLFWTEKIEKRMYNLYAEHFPRGFMFLLGNPIDEKIRSMNNSEREALSRGESIVDTRTLHGYLTNECGIDRIPNTLSYKNENNLKLTTNRKSGGKRQAVSLQVAARTFNYYGRTEVHEYKGTDVNKSLLWIPGMSYLTMKECFQSQYYNGDSDFTFRGLSGALKMSHSRTAICEPLMNKFYQDHKFIVKQIPKVVQNEVTKFNDFRDAMFAAKIFINSKGEQTSLIEMLRLVHPELKQLDEPMNENGVFKLKVITNKEVFDSYNEIEGEKDYEHVFYMNVDFRNLHTPEMKTLANLYTSILLTNFRLSDCLHSRQHVLSKGIAIDFNEDDCRKEIFQKNSLYDNFKYMEQDAPNDFLEAFQGFSERYGKHFSEEVMDLTCYLLSRKHKGMNSVFMYHNNQLTTTPNISMNPEFKINDGLVLRHEYYNRGDTLSKYVKARDNFDLDHVYYYTAKVIERLIEKEIKHFGKHIISSNYRSHDYEYWKSSNCVFKDDEGKIINARADKIGDLIEMSKKYDILDMRYDYANSVEFDEVQKSDKPLTCLTKVVEMELDDKGNSQFVKRDRDAFIDTYGKASDIMYLSWIVANSLDTHANDYRDETTKQLFRLIVKVYKLEDIIGEGLNSKLMNLKDFPIREGLPNSHKIKEGDTFYCRVKRYNLQKWNLPQSHNNLEKLDSIKIKVMKLPKTMDWIEHKKADNPEVILHVTIDDSPLSSGVLWYIQETLNAYQLMYDETNTPTMSSEYSDNVVERKNGKMTMELVINPSSDR